MEKAQALKVVSVDEGTPAADAGIQTGDYIVAIDYRSNVVPFLYYLTRHDSEAKARTFSIRRGDGFLEFDIIPEAVKN